MPLLVVDVGNTSTSFALVKAGRLLRPRYCPTDAFPFKVIKLIKCMGKSPRIHILACSVVPDISQKILKSLKRYPNCRLRLVGSDVRVPIRQGYRNAGKLGQDRLVNAYAAARKYGTPVLVFDYGTAITCDLVSKAGRFEGGLIMPGPEIGLEALWRRTSLLPRVGMPRSVGTPGLIGRSTVECMQLGIVQGVTSMTEGLVARFRRRYGLGLRVVATGGLAGLLRVRTGQAPAIDFHLTLRGLADLAKKAKLK